MKTLIILAYYDRPNMVRFALDSVADLKKTDYHLVIIDDGSTHPIMEVIDRYNYPFALEASIYETGDSIQDKISQGGSRHGEYINNAIEGYDADIGIMLCDDDALIPGYIDNLLKFYKNNPDIKYSYGHVLAYDPMITESYHKIRGQYVHPLNQSDQPINPFCRVDASQVSWRLKDFINSNIKFPSPQTSALDASVFQQMHHAWGPCVFNGLLTQYKGWFEDQIGNRKNMFTPIDKVGYG